MPLRQYAAQAPPIGFSNTAMQAIGAPRPVCFKPRGRSASILLYSLTSETKFRTAFDRSWRRPKASTTVCQKPFLYRSSASLLP